MSIKTMVLSPAEIKLILRLRQIANQGQTNLVLLDVVRKTVSIIKPPEKLTNEDEIPMSTQEIRN